MYCMGLQIITNMMGPSSYYSYSMIYLKMILVVFKIYVVRASLGTPGSEFPKQWNFHQEFYMKPEVTQAVSYIRGMRETGCLLLGAIRIPWS